MKLVFSLIIALSMFGLVQAQKDSKDVPKLSPEEIIAKHVASLGSPAAISAIRSRVLVGQTQLTSKVGYSGKLIGQSQFASSGDNIILATIFNSNDYPYEKAAFDGKDVSVGRPNGSLTPFGEFIKANKGIVRAGLFGGVLSTAWPLLDEKTKLKFENAGTVELSGRQIYKIKVIGVSDLKIILYFDAENFRHVATDYTQIKSVGITRRANPREVDDNINVQTTGTADMKETRMTLTERFSNFVKSGDVVVPMRYVIDYTYQDSNPGAHSLTLDTLFQNVYLNQDIAPEVFKVS